MSVPDAWKQAAVAITCGFETTGDPFVMVAGDFDKMGISCGALQWNIGMRSLQPMVRAVGEAVVRSAMPTFGAGMWSACTGSVNQGLAIVRGWQKTGSSGVPALLAQPKAELRALMGTPEMRREQQVRIDAKADAAHALAAGWATGSGDKAPSKRLFCWMFDIATQNGSLEGQTPKTVADFITANTPDSVDDVICDYLEATKGSGHGADARRNAALWRNAASGEALVLICLTYLRAQTANPKWRHVVINRKGSIAMGKGWVNGSLRDFSGHGL